MSIALEFELLYRFLLFRCPKNVMYIFLFFVSLKFAGPYDTMGGSTSFITIRTQREPYIFQEDKVQLLSLYLERLLE
jgi:hypothetical protein